MSVVGAGAAVLTLGVASAASPAVVTADRATTVSGAAYQLTLSAEDTLAATGQTVTVTGHGYPTGQGVYVSLCVIPDGFDPAAPVYATTPTPCLGGADSSGATGASHWVSSSFLAGLIANSSKWTTEGTGVGGFAVNIYVNPNISATQVCGQTVRCAIVTRADHTGLSNRYVDLFVPVTFQ
ncbi:hypothetical protein [Actinoplanes subglobosus]|uniref:Uncharacterized protein n=1 Tax=Actinoplanes subglobosus TaxID=1547892 RepID=A0ABV8J350_9ACTN